MRLPISRLVGAALVAVLAELAGIGLAATAAWLIVSAAAQPPLAALTVAIVVVRTLAIAKGGLRYAERLTGHSAVLRALAELRGDVYRALLRRNDIREGDALTRVVSDVDALQDALLRCVVPAVVAGIVGIAGLVATAFVSLQSVLVLACGLALSGIVLPFAAGRRASETARLSVTARAELADHMVDLVHGAAELEVYGARAQKLARADAAAASIAKVERQSGAFLGAAAVTVHIGTVLALAALLPRSPVSAAVILGVLAGMEVFTPLTSAAARWVEVRPAIARVRALLAEPGTPARPAPELEPIGHMAIVGPSGAGKSTLLAAIARRHPEARGAMADAHIFHTTVRQNLTFARTGVTQADLDEVAKLVQLDSWLRTLPHGWDTVISGDTVSGGQRQRLILARAVLAKAPILLLDEPVEGLEVHQGDEILAGVLAANLDRTVVLVTHRLSQLVGFDDIVVLADGRISDRGTHADLVRSPGYYQDSDSAERMILDVAGTAQRAVVDTL